MSFRVVRQRGERTSTRRRGDAEVSAEKTLKRILAVRPSDEIFYSIYVFSA